MNVLHSLVRRPRDSHCQSCPRDLATQVQTRAGLPNRTPRALAAARPCLVAAGDRLALLLGDQRHYADGKVVRLRHVGRDEPNRCRARSQERGVSAEPVDRHKGA